VAAEARPNAEILRWAREKSTLTLDVAAKKADVKPEKLAKWEVGEARPSIPQLRKLARVYKRPLAVFYLPAPPRSSTMLKDYRRLPGQVACVPSSKLAYEIRRASERREIALELADDLRLPLPTIGLKLDLSETSESAGTRVRTLLGVTRAVRTRWKDHYDALNGWKSALESLGVLVFQASDIPREEMRGFSISEFPMPVITVNSKDQPRGRIFTMVHEFAHLLLHQGGVCDMDEDAQRPPEEQRVEVFCNAVAAEAIVPMAELLANPAVNDVVEGSRQADAAITQLARQFQAGREVIVRRLLTANRVSNDFYVAKRLKYQSEFEKDQGSSKEPIPIPQFRKVLGLSGRFFTRLVLDTYDEEIITAADVSAYLGMKLQHLPALQRALRSRPNDQDVAP